MWRPSFSKAKGLHLRRGLTGLVWEGSVLSEDSSESAFGMSRIPVDGVCAVRWMLVRSLSSPSTLTIDGVKSAHDMGDFVHPNSASTSC